MKRASITWITDRQPISVQAWATDVPGLAAYNDPVTGWHLVHAASGMYLHFAETRENCVQMAEAVKDLCDWTVDSHMLPREVMAVAERRVGDIWFDAWHERKKRTDAAVEAAKLRRKLNPPKKKLKEAA